MANLEIIDQKGKSAGNVDLNEEIFGIEPNESVVFDAIIRQRAGKRQGTSAVKNRSAVRGGGKKPCTGRARQGSIRAPQWRGGGTVFGPTPRSYKMDMPRKARRLAMKSVLSQKVADNDLIILDQLTLEAPKTKEFITITKNLKVADEKLLMVLPEKNNLVYLSARNVEGANIVTASELNTYKILDNKKMVVTESSVAVLNQF